MSLDTLPREILLKIAEQLATKERVRSLGSVNKFWNEVVQECNAFPLSDLGRIFKSVMPNPRGVTFGMKKPTLEQQLQPLTEALSLNNPSTIEIRARPYRKIRFTDGFINASTRSLFVSMIERFWEIREGAPLFPKAISATIECRSDKELTFLLTLPSEIDLHLIYGPAVSQAAMDAAVARFRAVGMPYNVRLTPEGDFEEEDCPPSPRD